MFSLINFFKKEKPLSVEDRAENLFNPCSCGNTNYEKDDLRCMWFKCLSCGFSCGFTGSDELMIQDIEERREYGQGWWDKVVKEELDLKTERKTVQ